MMPLIGLVLTILFFHMFPDAGIWTFVAFVLCTIALFLRED